MTTSAWRGSLVLGQGWLVYRGPITTTTTHAHHAVQVLAASTEVRLGAPGRAPATAARALIPADVDHDLIATGQEATLIYLEPALVSVPRSLEPATWVANAAPLPLESAGGRTPSVTLLTEALGHRRTTPDPLVAAACEQVRRHLPNRFTLTSTAAAVNLSPTRLTHRFSAAEGIPFSRWVLWERLRLAAAAVACGSDLTTAAHEAGFADSSHLHRTFRRMFGVAPSDVAGVATWTVQM